MRMQAWLRFVPCRRVDAPSALQDLHAKLQAVFPKGPKIFWILKFRPMLQGRLDGKTRILRLKQDRMRWNASLDVGERRDLNFRGPWGRHPLLRYAR